MYYRRKIILSIIQLLGNETGKIQLMKLLLIVKQSQISANVPYYFEFVPYKFGCFSFEANYDLQALTTLKILTSDDKNYYLNTDNLNHNIELTLNDKNIIKDVINQFKNYTYKELMQYTYEKYPYYAINSSTKNELLTTNQLELIEKMRPNNTSKKLYTIGYEGISIDTYINKLITNNIKILIDVRRNASSMKKGFNKNQLITVLQKLDIQYFHFPELGIESENRRQLHNDSDYQLLFNNYESSIRLTNPPQLDKLLCLLYDNQRVAITCFESNICQCHRGTLAQILKKHPNWKSEYGIQHI